MIPIYVEKGVAYVWNSEDWHTLRSKYRICGAFIGSIASYPRQNAFLGLPMALMSEEAALLVEKGYCELFELPNIAMAPSDKEKQEIKQAELKIIEEQIEAQHQKKINQLSQKIDIIMAGKRQKLLSKGVTDIQLDKDTLLQEEINKLTKLAPTNVLTHLPTEHYIEMEKKKLTLEVLVPCIINEEGTNKYRIFTDLWEKGHHITNGTKFGCDYLAYPGDPVRFHATYMVRCVSDQTTKFSPTEIVAFGRLAVAVNKVALLACCNAYGKVEYQTLQWHDNTT